MLVSLLWRFPSLFDPPWVNDEGTYFAVAQAMAHGYRLYADVWENKPPGLYLLYSAVYHSFGASLIVIRAIAAVLSALLVVLTYRLTVPHAGLWAARAAALLTGLLLGVPFLEGTTLNAELPLAVLSAAAVVCALEYKRPEVAGALMVGAIAFKALAGFDAAALGIWLVVHHPDRVQRYVVGALAGVVVGGTLVWHAGVLAPMMQDALLYDLGYVGHGNGTGVPWLLAVKLVSLGIGTIVLRRSQFPYLWAMWAAVAALFSGRVFGHYTLQVVVPMCVALALLLQARAGPRTLVQFAGVFVTGALASAVLGWAMAATGHDSILARRLQYYANAARVALRTETYSRYIAQLDDHVARNERIAARMSALPVGTVLVWGNAPWIYVLAHRLPATPYTSSARQPEVPAETAALRRAVTRRTPAIVVVMAPPLPPLGSARAGLLRAYRPEYREADATVYVRTAGSSVLVPSGMARVIASANRGTR